jgi:hypothetical protein
VGRFARHGSVRGIVPRERSAGTDSGHRSERASFSLIRPIAAIACGAALALGARTHAQAPPAPRVVLLYRGSPRGVPRLDDFAAIRARGFSAVAWPAGSSTGEPEARRLAALVDLDLVRVDALPPGGLAMIAAERIPAAELAAHAWRFIAHGVRDILVDAGRTAKASGDGADAAWVSAAALLARHVSANARLFAAAVPVSPPLAPQPASAGMDVTLLDAERSWVLIATNTSGRRRTGLVHLPGPVPYALWVSLIDGSTLSMRADGAGPTWEFDFAAGRAAVYVIDKQLK